LRCMSPLQAIETFTDSVQEKEPRLRCMSPLQAIETQN